LQILHSFPTRRSSDLLITSGGWPRRLCRDAELHAKARSIPVRPKRGAAKLRIVPQRIDRPRSEHGGSHGGKTFETLTQSTQRLARVKRWGKSPPLRW